MKSYKEVILAAVKEEDIDLYVGLLSDLDYSGFEQEDETLKAYIEEAQFDPVALSALAKEFNFRFTIGALEEQNWNALWESNFTPVQVGDFVGLRADFHPAFGSQVQHELVITPKMSFGTGHHATTHMMIQQMQNLPLKGACVLDFGTGTGVLALLAEKLGAKNILAIDNDEWSIRNAQENMEANHAAHIDLQFASTPPAGQLFDIVLANINRNVIVDNFASIVHNLKQGGFLVLSGLLAEDAPPIVQLAEQHGLKHHNTLTRLNWISLLLSKRACN
ncbi:MAG: 50S ribosomal protein L11 methyltransferase [Chitinophagaceae bacterium]